MARITKHGEQRIKERVGVSKKIAGKIADKALKFGISQKEACGALKKYLDKRFAPTEKNNNTIVYNYHLFLFHDNILITVLPLPAQMQKFVDRFKKRKHEAEMTMDSGFAV